MPRRTFLHGLILRNPEGGLGARQQGLADPLLQVRNTNRAKFHNAAPTHVTCTHVTCSDILIFGLSYVFMFLAGSYRVPASHL